MGGIYFAVILCIGAYYLYKHNQKHSDKEKELEKVEDAHDSLDIEEKIVKQTNRLKERTNKLDEERNI